MENKEHGRQRVIEINSEPLRLHQAIGRSKGVAIGALFP